MASDNFNNRNILGRGGFGKVYKGRLADGTLVAIKRLKEERSPGGELQFQTEVCFQPKCWYAHLATNLRPAFYVIFRFVTFKQI